MGCIYMHRQDREALGQKLIELAAQPGAFRYDLTEDQRAAVSLQQSLAAYDVKGAQINPRAGGHGAQLAILRQRFAAGGGSGAEKRERIG